MTTREKILKLEQQLSGDFEHNLKIRDKIHNLRMIEKGIKPANQEIDCVGCGS